LGSNEQFVSLQEPDYPVLWINGVSFVALHFEGGYYTFSAIITDEAGKLLLTIDHGGLTVQTDVFDYRYEGAQLSVRKALGDIIFDATVSDALFAVHRGAFVDRFETGIFVRPDGSVVFTMSGLEVGSLAGSR
jgi:hypothetical protein